MKTIGIDIGTTTISLVCAAAGKIIEARTLENDSSLPANYPGERLQNPQRIEEIVRATLDEMLAAHPDTARIGLTGQMHGILYIDQEGRALSPLYTWQDQQGNLPRVAKRPSLCQIQMNTDSTRSVHGRNKRSRIRAVSEDTDTDAFPLRFWVLPHRTTIRPF